MCLSVYTLSGKTVDQSFEHSAPEITEEHLDQMVVLAERLRAENGGVLDDAAVYAVAEATGAPAEYVRLAIKLRTDKEKRSFLDNLRTQYMLLDPETRRYVISGMMTSLFAGMSAAEQKTAQFASSHSGSSYGLFGMIGLVFLTVALYNTALSRDQKMATISGAIVGGGFLITNSLFCLLLMVKTTISPMWLIPYTFLGAGVGLVLFRVVTQYRDKLGIKDPAKERLDLLRQLQSLQDKLKSGEQSMTFLSIDIVGSTKMKQVADPLDVEFTFSEYHHYVEMLTRKHSGSVHSTAGDGVTCAFPHPQNAFAAARNIQTGMIELNTFRNKVGMPIVVRQAIHTGTVVAPDADDIKSVHFASVIDIAAHLQKVAPPGSVVVSDAAATFIVGGPTAVGQPEVNASGVNGRVWIPRSTPIEAKQGTPPPLPAPATEQA